MDFGESYVTGICQTASQERRWRDRRRFVVQSRADAVWRSTFLPYGRDDRTRRIRRRKPVARRDRTRRALRRFSASRARSAFTPAFGRSYHFEEGFRQLRKQTGG